MQDFFLEFVTFFCIKVPDTFIFVLSLVFTAVPKL
jgi:hypothetical protein